MRDMFVYNNSLSFFMTAFIIPLQNYSDIVSVELKEWDELSSFRERRPNVQVQVDH